MAETLVDLDELVLKCKSPEARAYISEAVKCCKVGAFRAAIVSTWIAVVYDFVHKLRQLALSGDSRATKKLAEFDEALVDVQLALQFERELIECAHKEFEFISLLERVDLERLNQDRNRCAHPSMITKEEIYEPSAELARYHLRNAVLHLLQHPPVQGKHALQSLFNETLSDTFPTNYKQAIEVFRHGPLGNPKDRLLRDFVSATLITMLVEDHSDGELYRLASALMAVREMYRYKTDEIIKEFCSKTIDRLKAQDFYRVIKFLCYFEDSWHYLEQNNRVKVETYLSTLTSLHIDIVMIAIKHSTLREFVIKCLGNLDAEALGKIILEYPKGFLVDRAFELYSQSKTFSTANDRAQSLILPLTDYLGSKEIELLFRVGSTNDQIRESFEVKKILEALKKRFVLTRTEFSRLAKLYNVWGEHYQELFFVSLEDLDDIPF